MSEVTPERSVNPDEPMQFLHESNAGYEVIVAKRTIGDVSIYLFSIFADDGDGGFKFDGLVVGQCSKHYAHPIDQRGYDDFAEAREEFDNRCDVALMAIGEWKEESEE